MTAVAESTISAPSPQQLMHQLEQVEARLDQVRQGLVRSHRLATLGTLASVVAHEYSNILTAIISYCQLALARPGDDALSRKALEKSLSSAERAAKISSSILGFASDAHDDAPAHLPTAVEEALSCLARHPSKDGIELAVDVPDARLAISQLNLQQVLLNLLLNARKALRATGGGRLSVRGHRRGDRVQIRIADTGPGIAPRIRKRLFEPFTSVPTSDASGDSANKGTGLGLFICRQLIEAAGGTIGVDSDPGQGSSFWIDLPAEA